MPTNDYPDGYLAAREKFSRKFLQIYDERIDQLTPGVSTALATIVFMPVGLFMNWALNASKNELYRDLIQLSTDDAKRILIEQEGSIEAFRNHVIELKDCITCPIQSLEFILRSDVLDIIKRNANDINEQTIALQRRLNDLKAQAERLSANGQQLDHNLETEINNIKDQLMHKKTIMDKLRKAAFSQTSINELFYKQDEAERLSANEQQSARHLETEINNIKDQLRHQATIMDKPRTAAAFSQTSIDELFDERDEPVRTAREEISPNHNRLAASNHSFLISVMAHPATPILSCVLCVACLLAIGLLSPMSIGLTVAVSFIGVASLGMFASSCAISSSNAEQDSIHASRIAV